MTKFMYIDILDLLSAQAFALVMQSGSVALKETSGAIIDLAILRAGPRTTNGPTLAQCIKKQLPALQKSIEALLLKGLFEQGEQGLKLAAQQGYISVFPALGLSPQELFKTTPSIVQNYESLKESVVKRLIKCTAEMLGFDESTIELHHRFITDLGADSLDTIELVMALEDVFTIELSDEEAESIVTLNDAVNVIMKKSPT